MLKFSAVNRLLPEQLQREGGGRELAASAPANLEKAVLSLHPRRGQTHVLLHKVAQEVEWGENSAAPVAESSIQASGAMRGGR